MLILTAILLTIAHFAKDKNREISFLDSFIIGIAQAVAVIPGISRSGATISTALILGNKREEAAKFSFLMVLLPIIGANLLDIWNYSTATETSQSISPIVLILGFIAAFFTGWAACKWMIQIVKKSKLIYFAIYCLIVGSIALLYYFTHS